MDDLLFLEEMFEEHGRIDGMRDGEEKGFSEGTFLGIQKGFEFGKEIGFYLGFARQWLEVIKVEKYPERLEKQLQAVVDLCNSFNVVNQENDDPHALISKLQGKFKAVLTLTKSNQYYRKEQSSLAF
jgi:hypothetical protein